MKQYHLITENLSSRIAESYRVLRTNLQFSSLDKSLQTIVLTSTAPAEGKSTTGANLSIAFAQTGSKVLLIDADLRRPSLHKVFKISNQIGLTNLLLQSVAADLALREVGVPNLRVVTSGPIPPNPSEVLGSRRMHELLATLAKSFDYIILDTPPVLAVADSTILASMVDGVLLVVSVAEVSTDKAKKAKAQLEGVKANLLGVVLNGVEHAAEDDYYYYYYRARAGRQA
ncbi:MAG: CpsD/CapB family tyrosine-protein kinase [Peptococcaceae bacterium]|nr:CpsD/CapB family tyrosine-protein kinase [Peptococcaceae bacterium]